jgi:hypothetical protein
MPKIRDTVRQDRERMLRHGRRNLDGRPSIDRGQALFAEEDWRIAVRQWERMLGELDSAALNLYWVESRMVALCASAASPLPPFTPSQAVPSRSGFLAWSNSPMRLPQGQTWDAFMWFPDGIAPGHLSVALFTRAAKGLMEVHSFSFPLDEVVDHELMRNDHTQDCALDEASYRVRSMVAAAWLLMAQPRIADRRRLPGRPNLKGEGNGKTNDVQLIDIHRAHASAGESTGNADGTQVEYSHRWWVIGHWRQQACGPGRTQRRPVWISPHIKGPEGAPLVEERVYVWKR